MIEYFLEKVSNKKGVPKETEDAIENLKGTLVEALKHVSENVKDEIIFNLSKFSKEMLVQARDYIVVIDTKGKILYMNPYALDGLGFEQLDLVNLNYSELIENVNDDFTLTKIENLKLPKIRNIKYVKKDKNKIFINEKVCKVDLDKETLFFIISRDLTEINTLKEILMREQNKFSVFSENYGYWEWDIQTNEIWLSHSWIELLSFNFKIIEENKNDLGAYWTSRINKEDVEKCIENFNLAKNGISKTVSAKYRILDGQDNERWVESIGHVVEYDIDNKPRFMSGILRDIDFTVEERETLVQFSKHMPVSCAYVGVEDGLPYKTCTQEWLDHFGLSKDYTIETIIGKKHYEIFPELEKDRPDWVEDHKNAISTGKKLESPKGGDEYKGIRFNWEIVPTFDSKEIVNGLIFRIENLN